MKLFTSTHLLRLPIMLLFLVYSPIGWTAGYFVDAFVPHGADKTGNAYGWKCIGSPFEARKTDGTGKTGDQKWCLYELKTRACAFRSGTSPAEEVIKKYWECKNDSDERGICVYKWDNLVDIKVDQEFNVGLSSEINFKPSVAGVDLGDVKAEAKTSYRISRSVQIEQRESSNIDCPKKSKCKVEVVTAIYDKNYSCDDMVIKTRTSTRVNPSSWPKHYKYADYIGVEGPVQVKNAYKGDPFFRITIDPLNSNDQVVRRIKLSRSPLVVEQ